jgi:PrtD family type I secretion system ABC transporter
MLQPRVPVLPSTGIVSHARGAFIAIAAFSFFINLSVLASPIYMQQVFDRVLQTKSLETLFYLTLITLFFLGVFYFLDMLRAKILLRLGRWWDDTLRDDVLSAAVRSARAHGAAPSTVTNDLATVRGFVGGPQLLPFFDAPWLPLFVLAIWLMHPMLGAIATVAAVVLIGLALATERGTRGIGKDLAQSQARIASLASAALRHADSIHAMGMLSGVLRRYRRDNSDVIRAAEQVGDLTANVGSITKFVRAAVQILILGAGALLVTRAEISSGAMIAASIILGRALAPAEQAMGAWKSFVAARRSHSRLMELLAEAAPQEEKTVLPDPDGRITIEQASFILPGQEKAILRNISMTLEPGSVIAMIGHSGSGKSTLCKMLIGALQPTTGYVRLDGAAITRWNEEQLGRWVGYLPQTVDLFAGTVHENIARLTEAEDADVIAAAQLAGCHEMILRLPKAYETEIGDGGYLLSGGQRQRIGLARALFRFPRVLVLDEPNANLDTDGEAAMHKAIREMKARGATIVLVSHRLSALSVVDKVAVLKEGGLERFEDRNVVLKDLLKPVAAPGEQAATAQPAPATPTAGTKPKPSPKG